MKKRILFYAFAILFVANLSAQTALEKAATRLNIAVNIPDNISASANENNIYPCEITDDNPIPTIGQTYHIEFAQGNTAINTFFGMASSILQFKNEDCVVLVTIPPGKGASRMVSTLDSTLAYISQNIDFGSIKGGFRYGKPFRSVSLQEAEELNSMLHHYPDSLAQKLFNANVMVSYPINLRGNTYLDKYTRCKSITVGKRGREIFLRFFMTDESFYNFDKYLMKLEKAFWFSE